MGSEHTHGEGCRAHHGHGHTHGHPHGHGRSSSDKKTLVFVAILTGGYMVAEIVGGLLSGSLALLADAGHMALDTVAVAFGLFAAHLSQRPPTRDKTFGFYRAEILVALLNAATLIAASGWILFEAWQRLFAPAAVQGRLMTFVALGGLAVNGIAVLLMMRANKDSLNMRGVWLHLLTDVLGSVAAIVAAVLVWRFQWYLADPIISAVISLLILRGAWVLLRSCVNVLLVAVPDGVSIEAIDAGLRALPGVEDLHDLHVWALNTGVNSLTGHVQVAEGADYAVILEAATRLLMDKHDIEHVTIQIEPKSFKHRATAVCSSGIAATPHRTAGAT